MSDTPQAGPQTERLYYENPRAERFQARLLRQERQGDRWIVVLDSTAFYPEGGGQPADRGWLNGVPVLDVQDPRGEVHHFLGEPAVDPAKGEATGATVEGRIDFPYRYDYMQQHTGQHIVSATLIKAGGPPTISAHLGERYTAVEVDAGRIDEAQIEAAESLANRAVTSNLPVRTHWISLEEAGRFALRKPPPKVERLRVVEIEGVDAAACAGIHVGSTGEVGLIKFDGLETIRGRLRLHWLIGERAYADTRDKDRLVAALNRELTCGTPEILQAVKELKAGVRAAEQRIGRLERALAKRLAAELLAAAESISGGGEGLALLSATFRAEQPSGVLQALYRALLEQPKALIILLNHQGPQLRWWVGAGKGVTVPWKRIIPPLLPLIDGRGGGKESGWQGIGRRVEGADEFLARLKQALRTELAKGGGE